MSTPFHARRGLRTLGRALLDLLAPPTCAACDSGLDDSRKGHSFCASCELGIAPRDPQGCAACNLPAAGDGLCHRCQRRLFPLERIDAAFDYEGPIARAIQRLKYEAHDEIADPIAQRWLEELPQQYAQDPSPVVRARERLSVVVCPVPLHPKRLASRGFDQAWLLAKAIAGALKLPAAPRALRRDRATRPQVGLGLDARELNVRGAFRASVDLRGRHVLLVDDVLTTGATLRACAEAALASGATSVRALVLARAQP